MSFAHILAQFVHLSIRIGHLEVFELLAYNFHFVSLFLSVFAFVFFHDEKGLSLLFLHKVLYIWMAGEYGILLHRFIERFNHEFLFVIRNKGSRNQ